MGKVNYAEIARQSRIKVLDLIFKAQTSHIGSNFSCADIMAVLFEKIDLDKDKFILSAGWKVAMLYYHLWRKGKITEEELNSYCQPESKFIGLAEPMGRMVSGAGEYWDNFIPAAGGSMGIGFSMAIGMARARKKLGKEGQVYVLMSDGEMHCGMIWESAMKAAHEKLNNLIVIVDYNGLCAMGRTNEILNIEPLKDKFLSFGWSVTEINGHNFEEIEKSLFGEIEEFRKLSQAPQIIIAETTKGKGVSFMENNNLFHYKAPNEDEYLKALKELQ